jgi:hypothetical protein
LLELGEHLGQLGSEAGEIAVAEARNVQLTRLAGRLLSDGPKLTRSKQAETTAG